MFGGKVPLRCGPVKPGEAPYLIARVGLNRNMLLEAALKVGSGGRILEYPQEEGAAVGSLTW